MVDIMSTMKLNDGHEIPRLGLGVFLIQNHETCKRAVLTALEAGYRHIDTAKVYENEEAVGEALRECGLAREDIFVTTKLAIEDLANPHPECEASLKRLGLDYVDLYLLHWPRDDYMVTAWEGLQELRDEGKCRSIGVSNWTVRRFEEGFFPHTDVIPSVNQVELHPFWTRTELADYCKQKGIAVECYSPLARAERLDDPRLTAMADTYGKSPAQIMIRWSLQHDYIVIPKSSHPERIRQNGDVFDFEISAQDMQAIDAFNEDLVTLTYRPRGYY